MRFHETAALRRVSRTRLELPCPYRSSVINEDGLFDSAAFDGGETIATTAVTSGRARRVERSGAGAMESSLLDLVFLPDVSVLLGLVYGSLQVCLF